jgi:single-strand DNA-binding protein
MRMDAATVTIVGRAATNPTVSASAKGDRVTFRVVSTERRYDEASQVWVDGDEYGVGVVCWRQLAKNVLATVRKGDPVVVIGRISTRKYDKNGSTEYFTDVKGDLVGLDVAKLGTRFARTVVDGREVTEPSATASGAPEVGPIGPAADHPVDPPTEPLDDGFGAPWDADANSSADRSVVLTS